MTQNNITAQKIVWWMMVTLSAIIISITGGWVGYVNASIVESNARDAKIEALVANVNYQYTQIIQLITKENKWKSS